MTMDPALAIAHALKHGHDISVCRDCALANGAAWPEGHVATHWQGECGVCGKDKGVCALSDWRWPGRDGQRMQVQREI